MRLSRVLLAAPTAALVLAFASPAHADESVHVQLQDLNATGAKGTATLTVMNNGDLKVSIRTSGMTPNAPHAQHIHGATTGKHFTCPTKAADKDGDGFVNTEEGLPDYGDVFVSLTTTGDTSKASGLAVDRMPTADAQGNLSYERTLAAAELPAGTTQHIKKLHVVQHGIDVNKNGKYDLEALGESTFAKSLGVSGLPEEATNPATCGMVSGAAAGAMPHGGVETGDGSTGTVPTVALYTLGGVALVAAAATVLGRRRVRAES
jgi:hypothetical protein